MIAWLAISTLIAGASALPSREYCKRGDERCWPTASDVAALTQALDPSQPRVIKYEGGNNTFPAPIPDGAQQPLFGFGESGLPPVVTTSRPTGPCFVGKHVTDEDRPTCLVCMDVYSRVYARAYGRVHTPMDGRTRGHVYRHVSRLQPATTKPNGARRS